MVTFSTLTAATNSKDYDDHTVD